MAELTNPIAEAKRYLSNAKTILKEKAIKDGIYYTDSKYTRMAGNCMWNGCLIALSYALNLTPSRNQRLDINDFKAAATKRSKKLLTDIVEGYNVMHLYMGYDGTKSVGTISDGVKIMKSIIDWCEANAPKALNGTKTTKKRI